MSEFAAGDDALFREVLRSFPVDPHALLIDSPSPARGFSGAVIRRITIGADAGLPGAFCQPERYCLRGWPPRGLPVARLRELHRFLGFLHERGVVVVPVPIPAISSGTLVSHRGRDWQLEPWMPGAADFDRAPSDARLTSTITTLAQLHREAACYQPTTGGNEWFAGGLSAPSPAVDERLAILNRWTVERIATVIVSMSNDPDARFGEIAVALIDRFRMLQEHARQLLMELRQTAVPLHVCLRDVWHDHVLFTGDTVTGIIDLSAARTETVAADLSRLLGSMLGAPSDRWETALDAYHAIRPLSHDEHRLIRALQLSGALLSGMTWIDRRTGDAIPAELLPAVVARMEGVLSQLP